ncbi:hypothetical protein B7494_g2495 [Chlorociboria aeruginascens]|nr:hypothetical protein B7494_g2495 [Chlorociboria aeruginascens]
MTPKANPEDAMVIRDLNPSVTTISVPFLRLGLVKFGGRATIVKLRTGSLFIFSPVALTPAVRQKLTTLGGAVKYICAPDLEHHLYLTPWHSAFPAAHFIAPSGLAEKRAKASASNKAITAIPFQTIFTKENKHTVTISQEFDDEFEYEYVDAHMSRELVFFHKPTSTLIEADLLFNLPATEQYSRSGEGAATGWVTRVFGYLQSTKGSAMGQKYLLWYVLSRADRAGFAESVRRIERWGAENIVPCHGDLILGQGREVWKRVFAWHLQGKK